MQEIETATALITDDTVVLGLLAASLGLVFWTAARPDGFWKRFYTYVPSLLLCYFIPAVFNSVGLIDGNTSGLYPMARDYLLPVALVLLTLSIDFEGILRLGPKAIIMFLVGTFGVMFGAVFAFGLFEIISPQTVAGDTWRGMATVAGSWIGGGANQAAMKEVFKVDGNLFGGKQTREVFLICHDEIVPAAQDRGALLGRAGAPFGQGGGGGIDGRAGIVGIALYDIRDDGAGCGIGHGKAWPTSRHQPLAVYVEIGSQQ